MTIAADILRRLNGLDVLDCGNFIGGESIICLGHGGCYCMEAIEAAMHPQAQIKEVSKALDEKEPVALIPI